MFGRVRTACEARAAGKGLPLIVTQAINVTGFLLESNKHILFTLKMPFITHNMLFRSQLSKPTGSGECVCMSKTPEVSDLDSEFLFLFSVLCF